MVKKENYILWFDQVGKEDVGLVGGKGANLGEMTAFGIPVPRGFIVTSRAYFEFIEKNNLRYKIHKHLDKIDVYDTQQLNQASAELKRLIRRGDFPGRLSNIIIENYLKLGGIISHGLVAIRSSATAEDLPTASFAGQQVTFLNVKGESNVINGVRECWASLFEPRAIFYRQEKGFDHLKVGMAVPVQEMAPAYISGVMFTVDPVTNQKDRIIIEAIYGLGEYIVQGTITPDSYIVDKKSFKIIKRQVSKQTVQLLKSGSDNREKPVAKSLQHKRKLSDKEIVKLAEIGNKIHKHYYFPQDIEWTFYKNRFYIVQTRPVTTIKKLKSESEELKMIKRNILLKGQPASPGMAAGPAQIIKNAKQIKKIDPGEILVAPMTSPDFVPAMKKAVAIVTDKGGQTSHAAIVSRELGIPCVVGTEKATKVIKDKQIITVNGSKGEVYQGGMWQKEQKRRFAEKKKIGISAADLRLSTVKTATKIYVNLAEPDLAYEVAGKNVDGIGLARAEFMAAEIGIHPKKLIREGKEKQFIEKMTAGMEKFCRAFYPRPVVYRATDFKTNEYRNLIGGKSFEPEEENPFIGFRGAFRYISDSRVFEMELKAIKKTRISFNNLWLMVPFVRTPEELKKVKKIIVSQGLIRSSSFKLWLMVEVPSNVILLEDFIKIGIDGVSIGSNDLTMLILGADRDNASLAGVFDERNPAVLWALQKTIKTCAKHHITSSICGQAPSIYSGLVEQLVRWGITSLSVNPDAIEGTRELVYETEESIAGKKR